jgi:N-methylhydantoinase A
MQDVHAVALQTVVDEMRDKARAALAREGFRALESTLELWLDLRYEGQAHELSVRCSDVGVSALEQAVGAFHVLHAQLYGHSFADVTVELVNVRVTGHGTPPSPSMWWNWSDTVSSAPATAARRPVYFHEAGDFLDTQVLNRRELGSGESVAGPAVIHQLDATVLIPPGLTAVVHPTGSMVLAAQETTTPASRTVSTLDVWR